MFHLPSPSHFPSCDCPNNILKYTKREASLYAVFSSHLSCPAC